MDKSWENYLLEEAQIVFKYLLKIGATKEDAEDVVQQAIMKTIECISQVQVEKLRAWLFKVALHRYYTLYNKNKRSASNGIVVTGTAESLKQLQDLPFIKASSLGVVVDKY